MWIEFDGLRAELDVPTERAWEVLKFAAGVTAETPESGAKEIVPPLDMYRGGTIISGSKTKAERIREVAAEILADGRFHPRRELCAAARERGLDPNHLDSALKGDRFERNRNGEAVPVYRDNSAVPPEPATHLGTLNGDGP